MKIFKHFVLIFILLLMKINAQEIINTSVKTSEIHMHFFNHRLKWAIPISSSERLSLNWIERKNSFTKDGIRSFVGYEGNSIKAVLSISSNSIFGNIFTDSGEFQITDTDGVLKLIKEKTPFSCLSHKGENTTYSHQKTLFNRPFSSSNATNIKNSDVLRLYRLAILIDYSVYNGVHFGNRNKVETFLSSIETFLNEMYIRDLGIKFEVLHHDALIRDTPDKVIFPDNNLYNDYYAGYNTRKLNQLIGNNSYDIGLVLTLSRNGGGIAFLRGGYKQDTKGAATANTPSNTTIAHEIGHLFGARHTFSNSSTRKIGDNTDQIEIGRGYSVMSYGSPRDFFALYSIYKIREELNQTPYYEDETRSFIKGYYEAGVTNIPLGIAINNQAPIIDKTKIKAEYTIPKNTYFQFYIPANDTDGDKLQYLAHQTDVRPYPESSSIAKFITRKASLQNHIAFQPIFNEDGGMFFNTDIIDMGTFTFWLSARDFRPTPQQYITKYDLAETKVNIIEGTPLKLTNKFEKQYNGNGNIQLTWSVDNKIFPADSKVRILLSDDFGQTFKHILVDETENDGSHEITLPNIEIGTVKVGNLTPQAGVIKVEVIDNIAYDLSEVDPKKEGFIILPDDTLSIKTTSTSKKSLSPNPVKDIFRLEGFNSISSIKIYDMVGRKVKQFEPQTFYNISELPKGHYIVIVKSQSGTEQFKILIL